MAEPTMHITGEQSEPSISMAAGETPSVDGAVMKVAGETAEAGVQISVQAETPEPGIETETMGDGMPPEDLREPRERVTHWADHEFENNVTIAGTLRTKRWVHPHGCMFRTEEKLKEEYPQPTKGMWAMVGGCFPGSIWICEKDGEWNRAIEGAVTESDVAAKLMLYATKEWVKKYHKETYGPTQIDEDALNRYLNEYKYMTEKSVEDYLEEYMRGHGNEGKCECDELLRRLFTFHADSNTIEANFSLWSNGFITAKGKGPDGSDTPAGATVLSALNDVALSGLAAGQVLKFDGSKWVNADAILDAPDIDLSGYLAKSEAASLYAAVNHTHSQYALSSDLAGFLTKTYALTMQAGIFSAVTYDPSAKAAAVSIPTSTDHLAEGASKFFTEDRAKSALAGHTSDSAIHVTADDKAKWNGADELLRRLFTFHADSNTIEANFSLWSDGFITAKGKGPDGSAASGLDPDAVRALLVQWDYVTRADLPSLSEYATEKWVNAQGFLTRHQSLAGYLTKTAADNAYQPKGDYLTSVSWADVGGKPTWIGASKPSYSWGEIGSKPAFAYTAAECTSYTADGSDKGVTAAAVKKAFTLFKAVPPAFSEVTTKPTTLQGYGITDAYDKAAIDSKVTAINTAINGKVSKSGDTMSGALTVNAKVTAQSLTIGSNTLTWDADAKAWKIDGNLYATGFITAKGQGAGGSASAGGLDLAALEAYLTQNKYATQSWVNGLGHITKAAADSAYQPKGSYAAANHTHSQYLTAHQSLDHIIYLDRSSVNPNPFDATLSKGIEWALKLNSTDGLSDGGSYHGVLNMQQWGDSSGGAAHQLAFTDSGNMWMRHGTSAWSAWKRLAFTSDLSAYLPLSGGTISSAANGPLNINSTSGTEVGMRFYMSNVAKGWVGYNPTYGVNLHNYAANRYVGLKDDGQFYHQGSNVFWHAGNDGAGSGLDADLLDGVHNGNLTARKLNLTEYRSSTSDTSNLAIIKQHYTELPGEQASALGLRHGSLSMAFGWRLSGAYNSVDKAYCGWFISDYGTPRWIGADNGAWKSETFAFLSSNVASATSAASLRDRTTNTATYLNYGAASLSTASWLAAWNGYELRAMSPANVLTTINALSRNGGSMANTNVVTNLNADLLDGKHRSNLFNGISDWLTSTTNLRQSITVGGDANTYYPVVISVSDSKDTPTRISVWKNLGSTTPSYSGNHSNGTSSMWLLYEGRATMWDGNGGFFRTLYRSMPYANLCAATSNNNSSSGSLIVYLRGGGCQYFISATNAFSVNIYYASTNIGPSSYPFNIAPTTTLGNLGVLTYKWSLYGNVSADSVVATAGKFGLINLHISDEINRFGGTLFIQHRGEGQGGYGTTGNVVMCDRGGSVGIGTATPAYKLDVNGSIRANGGTLHINAPSGSYVEGIRIHQSSGNWCCIALCGSDNTGDSGTSATTWGIFNNNGNFYINKNGSSIQQAPRLWGHANGWSVGNTSSTSYALNAASFICDSWVRTRGAAGWYSETYGGGWYMTDSTWIRNYNNKALYMNTAIIRTDGQLQVGGDGAYFLATSTGVTSGTSLGVKQTDGNSGYGISLYGGASANPSYGILFALTSHLGKCGSVSGDWATYFTMAGANTRGWVFRDMTNKANVAAISSAGVLYTKTGIYSDGYITAKTGSSSDARLKDIIGSPSLTLEQVAASPLVRFRWKKDGGIAIGTIAQHWLNVLKEVVYKDPDGYYAVQYGVLADAKATVVARAVMGHERRIEALERENRELKERIKQLEAA